MKSEDTGKVIGDEVSDEPVNDSWPRRADAKDARSVTMALAWLPANDYEQAVKLWPDLAASDVVAGPDGPLPHRVYCQTMQRTLVEFAEAGALRLAIAPIRVAPFTAWCAEKAYEPDSAEARAEFAAQLAVSDDPGVVSWPPGRNDACWCGSGRKYKKCCAADSFEEIQP